MSDRRLKFIYRREGDKRDFRGQATEPDLEKILQKGVLHNQPLESLRWATGNFDFILGRPRITPAGLFSELWYKASWEQVSINALNLPTGA